MIFSIYSRSALEPSTERVNGATFSEIPVDVEEKDIPLDDEPEEDQNGQEDQPQYEEEKLEVCLKKLVNDPSGFRTKLDKNRHETKFKTKVDKTWTTLDKISQKKTK